MSYPVIPPTPFGSYTPVPAGDPMDALLRRRNSPLAWAAMITFGVGGLVMSLLIVLSGGPLPALVCALLAAVSFPLVHRGLLLARSLRAGARSLSARCPRLGRPWSR